MRQQPQLFEAGDVGFDVAHGEAKAAFLLEEVCAEASKALCVVGKVNLSFLFESFGQVFGNDVPKDFVHPIGGGAGRFDGDELSVNSDDDRRINFDVDVRSAAVDSGFQYASEDFHWKTFWNGRRASSRFLEARLERWQSLRQVGKTLLRDGRNAREGDGDGVSFVFVSAAFDDGSAAVNFLVLGSGLKI